MCEVTKKGKVLLGTGNWNFDMCRSFSDPLDCYFDPHPNCLNTKANENSEMAEWQLGSDCVLSESSALEYSSSASEFLFNTIRPWVLEYALQAANNLFPTECPKEMIGIHLRRSDKKEGMKLHETDVFIDTVKSIVEK